MPRPMGGRGGDSIENTQSGRICCAKAAARCLTQQYAKGRLGYAILQRLGDAVRDRERERKREVEIEIKMELTEIETEKIGIGIGAGVEIEIDIEIWG